MRGKCRRLGRVASRLFLRLRCPSGWNADGRLADAHRNCYSYPYSALWSLSNSGPSRILKVSYMQYSGITVGSCKSGDFVIASLSSQSGPTAAKTRPYALSKYWSLWLARGECIIVFMGDTR